jgi:hypothetical protein
VECTVYTDFDFQNALTGFLSQPPNYQFLPSKSVKKGEYSPVECTVYTDFDFQNALFGGDLIPHSSPIKPQN